MAILFSNDVTSITVLQHIWKAYKPPHCRIICHTLHQQYYSFDKFNDDIILQYMPHI